MNDPGFRMRYLTIRNKQKNRSHSCWEQTVCTFCHTFHKRWQNLQKRFWSIWQKSWWGNEIKLLKDCDKEALSVIWVAKIVWCDVMWCGWAIQHLNEQFGKSCQKSVSQVLLAVWNIILYGLYIKMMVLN